MARNKLLVEGKNDQIVISTLCQHHDIWAENKENLKKPPLGRAFDFECKNKGNDDKLLDADSLSAELKASGVEAMGIVVDADSDLPARWREVRERVRNLGYETVPFQPDPTGTIIISNELPTIGVWLMPDNRIEGMLEHFVELLIPPGDALWPHAQKCTLEIADTDRPFAVVHLQKAQIHTWLAWREVPGVPMGTAIQSQWLDANSPQALLFVNWLKRLFKI